MIGLRVRQLRFRRRKLHDRDCVDFLQWALPRLHLRWEGLREVRRQVRRRLARRLWKLGLPDLEAYRAHLAAHPEEWQHLDGLCRIPISRFYRDRRVFDAVREKVLPALAQAASAAGRRELWAWSAACASGEEAYTLTGLWQLDCRHEFPTLRLRVVATEADAALLERAQVGRYRASKLREFPEPWLPKAFERRGESFRVRDVLREGVSFECQDLRQDSPDGPFDLVLCRNAAFTYFDESLQRKAAARIARVLRPGGALVLGSYDSLPAGVEAFAPWLPTLGIHRRLDSDRDRWGLE